MTIERTTHLAVSIGLFERMDDKTLLECFKSTEGKLIATDIRDNLAALRSEGYEFYPCACGHYDANGACNGGVNVPTAESEQPSPVG